MSLKTSRTRASHSDSNHSLQPALIRANFSNSEAFRWVNSSVSSSHFDSTHFFARTELMSEIRWLSCGKTKTKITETNALMLWSWNVESHMRTDNLQTAASHPSFTNESNPLTGTGLNEFVSSLLEPPPPVALLYKHRSTKYTQILRLYSSGKRRVTNYFCVFITSYPHNASLYCIQIWFITIYCTSNILYQHIYTARKMCNINPSCTLK